MSFGWSAGDIASGLRLIWIIGDALRASGGSVDQRKKAEAFLQVYQLAISVVQECYIGTTLDDNGDPVLDDPQMLPALNSLKTLDTKLKKELDRTAALEKNQGENSWGFVKRQFHKVLWPFLSGKEVETIRTQIVGQIQVLQPILQMRQSQKASSQSALQHDELLMNFEIVKDLIRSASRQSTAQHLELRPFMGPDAGVPQAAEPPPYAGYDDARNIISQYSPRPRTDETSAALKKLKGSHKLVETLRSWLLESDYQGNNCLWLLSSSAVQFSGIMYDVGTHVKMPVLAYSCRQLDENGNHIATRTLFTQMLYAFLEAVLEHLQTSKDARQRIDTSLVASLNGEFVSAAGAITLLGNLFDNVPSACICIIDHFERLDVDGDPQVTALLKDFLGLFRQDAGRLSAQFKGRHKLLVTTRGPTGLLADMTSDGDLERLRTDDHVDKGRYWIWEELKTASEASI